MLLAHFMPTIKVRSFGTALAVAFIVGILDATVGFLLRLPLNIITLGLLSFLVRLIVTAIVLRIVDYFFRGFVLKNFTAAFILAVCMALVGTIFQNIFY
ncbi:MAG: hypothetical protein JWN76_1021 [Chitinophagaceae bacterium]|nr:hypothetical protein [Chitinophagaceae bacterium]